MNNLDIKVSIIVPVYNCQDYLKRCIKSLINQTLQDIEIILINDGSTDNSGQLCDLYSKEDSRIIVVHQDNGGQFDARNSGLKIAKGEYIGFVDADDFVELTMYEKLYLSAIQNSCDISVCDYYRFFNEDSYSASYPIVSKGVQKSEIVLTKFIGNKLADFENQFSLASVCRCLYSYKLIKTIRFSPIRNIEDRLFNIEVFLKAKKVYYLPEPLYYYFYNSNSITTSYDNFLCDSFIYSFEKVNDLLKDKKNDYDEELYTSKLIHFKAIIINEAMDGNHNTFIQSINNISKFKKKSELHSNMYKKVRKNMKISNKIIYQLLKYRCDSLVLMFYKLRRKYMKVK